MMMMNDEATTAGKYIGGGGMKMPSSSSSNSNSNNAGNDFIKKPGKGWLHSDESIQDGITYVVKYVGFIGVRESMKSLSFDVRTQVARESIRRVAESAKCINLSRRSRHLVDDQVNRILSNACVTEWSGMNVQLHINTQVLKVTQLECNDTLFQHTMQNISFACGGDLEIQDFIAYVAKDDINGRACYVFECSNNLANSVITTVGQAFELRFKKFLNSMPSSATTVNATSVTNGIKQQKNLSPTHSNTSETKMHLHHQETTPNGNKQAIPNTYNPNMAGQNKLLQQQQQQQTKPPTNLTSATTALSPTRLANKQVSSSSSSGGSAIIPPPPPPMGTNHHHHHHHQPQQYHPTTTTTTTTNKSNVVFKVEENLEKMPWFHGLMARESAERLLMRDGDYLVRETNKAEKQYVLSGRYKGECRHIFLVDPSGVIRTKDRVFDNICHLIQYHQDNKIPIISKENELLLEHPIYRN